MYICTSYKWITYTIVGDVNVIHMLNLKKCLKELIKVKTCINKMEVHLRICNEKDFFSMPRSYEKCMTHISWYMECTHEVHDSQLHLQN